MDWGTTAVKVKQSGSWLDHECAGILGWKLGKRLWSRVSHRMANGEKGVMLTLTYRHSDYRDAEDLYQSQKERQDVPLFMRRLGRALRRNLTGDWICKMEFQQGGWVHFHIILMGIDHINHSLLTLAWGHGHTWINRLNKKRVIYMVKYVAKGGKIPLFLYSERPRSVKIIRVSKGFWGEPSKPSKPRCPIWDEYGPKEQGVVNAYVPIGIKLMRKGVVLRSVDRNNGKTFLTRRCEPAVFCQQLHRRYRVLRSTDGWMRFACTLEQALAVADLCESHEPKLSRAEGSGAHRPRSGLHLRGISNHDAAAFRENGLPWWIEAQYWEDALDDTY